MRKLAFCICEKKDADQLLIHAFDFAIPKLQSIYYRTPKFQASSHLLLLYSPVCVRLVWKPGFVTKRFIYGHDTYLGHVDAAIQ